MAVSPEGNVLFFQQLLCLVLQIVATLALVPEHHTALTEADLPDCLTQLILPSDEWYYTNHSTKYARYVKHHAARVLVYLGMEQRLRHKVNLFDMIGERDGILDAVASRGDTQACSQGVGHIDEKAPRPTL